MINFTDIQVPPCGPSTARVAIVGEAPSAEEAVQRLPFIGGSGQLLRGMLADNGIDADQCYMTNVVKNRPPNNEISLAEPPAFDPFWLAMLQAELREVRPNVIFALGSTALNALCNFDENLNPIDRKPMSISSWRGSILECKLVPGLKVVVSLHPVHVLRMWSDKVLLEADTHRLAIQAKFPEIRRKPRTFHLFPSLRDSLDWLEEIKDPYAIDIEGINGEIACLGVAKNDTEALCIPFVGQDLQPYWNEQEELIIWKAIGRRLNSQIPIIGQNLLYDLFWLILYGNVPHMKFMWDTMLMFNLINPEMEKSLAILCSLYTEHPYYKDDGKIWTGKKISDEQFFKYNLTDCVVTHEAYGELIKELQESGLYDFYQQIVGRLPECVMKPMQRGVKVDIHRQMTVYDEYQKRIEANVLKFQQMVGRDMNPRSTQQLAKYLYEEKGIPKQYNRKTKQLTVDDGALEKISTLYVIPELDVLGDIREDTKIASTYLNPAKLDSDVRMRTTYNIAGTDSGRMSSSASPTRKGANLQNVTHGLCRSIYIPDTNMVWLECDQSQAEVRIVAHVAPEPRLIELYRQGVDVHKFNASIAFDVEYKDVTKPQRFVAKHLVHAGDYDVQEKTFALTINKKSKEAGIPIHFTNKMAREKLEKYHGYFTEIRNSYHLGTQRKLLESPVLYNLLGRPHMFLDRYGPDMFRKAYNYIPQSTVADVENIGWIRFNERYPQYAVMMQIHDALMIQCRMDEVDKVKEALNECFDIELEANGIKFKIPVEFKITSTRWSEMKDA